MTRRRGDTARLRPLRTVAFAVSSAVTLVAVVAALGLLPDPAAGATHSAASTPAIRPAPDWPPAQPPVEAAPRAESGDAWTLRPPAASGSGRRVVFDESAQRVWLVRAGGSVLGAYLVSGSAYDNLQPGRFQVYSTSRHATSFDLSSTMRWMVRFTHGATAAIGFHDIPHDRSGEAVQTWSQLGTPQSHGCIRQRPRDARMLWQFAPVGTRVVVVA